MEKNTAKRQCRRNLLWTTSFLLVSFNVGARLVDQTVGLAGSHVITLRDVRVQSTVYFLLQREQVPQQDRPDLSSENLLRAREAVMTDWLIQDYLQNIQTPLDISEENINVTIKNLLAIPKDDIRTFLQKEKIDESDVKSVVERRLRLDEFYEKQLGFRVTLLPVDLKEHYEKHKKEKYLSKPYEEVESIVKADLKKQRLQQEFQQWVDIQVRRTELLFLPMSVPERPS